MRSSTRVLSYVAGLAAVIIIVGVGGVLVFNDTTEAPPASEGSAVAAAEETSPVGTWSGHHQWVWGNNDPYRETVRLQLDPCVAGGDDCGTVSWLDTGTQSGCVLSVRYLGIEDGRFLYMVAVDNARSEGYCESHKLALKDIGDGNLEFELIHQLFGTVYTMTLKPEE